MRQGCAASRGFGASVPYQLTGVGDSGEEKGKKEKGDRRDRRICCQGINTRSPPPCGPERVTLRPSGLPAFLALCHAALSGRALLIRSRSRGECVASQRSLRRCTFNQNSGLLPNTRASMSAVGAVTLRRSLQSSLTCLRCTPIASASAPCVSPIGSMNSSINISPTLAGLRLVVNVIHLTNSYGRPDIHLSLRLGRDPNET